MRAMLWDVFCQVVDNHGDIGVCWRLARQLAARGQRVRLWVDNASALAWMAPGFTSGVESGGAPGVEVRPWRGEPPAGLPPGDVLIEAFGCDIPPAWVVAVGTRGAWINLEYLSAEGYVERMHGLPSPVLAGPLAGRSKHFFYPGFTPRTGGLLREDGLAERQARFDRAAWLREHAPGWQGERVVPLFCYEPAALAGLLDALAAGPEPTRLLVTPGRAAQAMRALREHGHGALRLTWLPHLPQPEFDHLLWAGDLNFVRGEDSLVRALWAGRPFVWHIYPQHDNAHHAKLDAFLDWLDAPASLRDAHRAWNGVAPAEAARWPTTAAQADAWAACARTAREHLLPQQDLARQLQAFAEAHA